MILEINQLASNIDIMPEDTLANGYLNEIMPVLGTNSTTPDLLGKENLARIQHLPEDEAISLSRQLAEAIRENKVDSESARFGIPLAALTVANLFGSEANLLGTNIPEKGWEITSNIINNMWQWANHFNGLTEIAAKAGVVFADVYVFMAGVAGIVATADAISYPLARVASKLTEPLAHAKYHRDVNAFLNSEGIGSSRGAN